MTTSIGSKSAAEPHQRVAKESILGVRERSDKLVHELVLDHPAPFVPLMMKKRGKEIDYEAKTVMVAGRRYIAPRRERLQRRRKRIDRISFPPAPGAGVPRCDGDHLILSAIDMAAGERRKLLATI